MSKADLLVGEQLAADVGVPLSPDLLDERKKRSLETADDQAVSPEFVVEGEPVEVALSDVGVDADLLPSFDGVALEAENLAQLDTAPSAGGTSGSVYPIFASGTPPVIGFGGAG